MVRERAAPKNRKKQLTAFQKGQIVERYKSGASLGVLAKAFGRSREGIRKTIKVFEETGSMDSRPGRGRDKKINSRALRIIVREVEKDPFISSVTLKQLSGLGNVSNLTIRRALERVAGIKSYWAARKPFISEQNRIKRLAFARDHINWTNEQWAKVMWTDESPFHLRIRGKERVFRRLGDRYKPKYTKSSVKHDKKIWFGVHLLNMEWVIW